MKQETLLHVMETNYMPLKRKAISILHHDQDAEDALQNAYVQAWIHRNDVSKESNYLAWINRIVYNESISILRKRKSWSDISQGSLDSILSLSDVSDECILKCSLEEAMLSIPPNYSRPLYLHYCMGYNITTIAKMLDISENTVKTRLFHARRRARLFLSS